MSLEPVKTSIRRAIHALEKLQDFMLLLHPEAASKPEMRRPVLELVQPEWKTVHDTLDVLTDWMSSVGVPPPAAPPPPSGGRIGGSDGSVRPEPYATQSWPTRSMHAEREERKGLPERDDDGVAQK